MVGEGTFWLKPKDEFKRLEHADPYLENYEDDDDWALVEEYEGFSGEGLSHSDPTVEMHKLADEQEE